MYAPPPKASRGEAAFHQGLFSSQGPPASLCKERARSNFAMSLGGSQLGPEDVWTVQDLEGPDA